MDEEKIVRILSQNADKAPKEMIADWQNLPINKQINAYDKDAVNAFIKKWAPYIQENFQNWEELDYSAGVPLKERMTKDGVNPTLMGNTNYLEGLARKYSSTPEEVSKTIAEIGKEKEAADEKQKLADEYKREAEAKFARQKAVDDYQHSYLGMDLDNPINRGLNWLADLVISDKTKKAVVEDPNATGRALANVGVDVVGTGADFLPGIGGIVVGPALRTGRNIAEGDKTSEALIKGGLDLGANAALAKGLKGIPGVKDFGPMRKVEEMLPTSEWSELVEKGTKKFTRAADEIPVKTKHEAYEWISKQPAEHRDFYKAALEKDGVKGLETARKQIIDENLKTLNEKKAAKQWMEDHKIKTVVGEAIPQVTVGSERTGVHTASTSEEPKMKNPSKIKTHSDAIDFIIDNQSKQWEAGFKPHDMSGIVGEAYKKWESER